jgi:hypothetical protein
MKISLLSSKLNSYVTSSVTRTHNLNDVASGLAESSSK